MQKVERKAQMLDYKLEQIYSKRMGAGRRFQAKGVNCFMISTPELISLTGQKF
jgi:hypothetical protein